MTSDIKITQHTALDEFDRVIRNLRTHIELMAMESQTLQKEVARLMAESTGWHNEARRSQAHCDLLVGYIHKHVGGMPDAAVTSLVHHSYVVCERAKQLQEEHGGRGDWATYYIRALGEFTRAEKAKEESEERRP